MKETYKLRTRTGAVLCGGGLPGDVPVLARLSSVKPTADAQSFVSLSIHDDFLDRVKTLSRLYLEKDELVPARWDCLDGDGTGLRDGPTLLHGVELECATVLYTPWFADGEGHVENV